MKTAIILGIDSTLGKEITKDFISKGYKIIGTYHTEKPKEFIDGHINLFQLSIENRTSVSEFLAGIKDIKIDILINTIANTLTFDRFEKIPIESFEKDLLVNVVNYVYILQKLISNFNANSNIIMILTEMTIGEPPNYFSSYVASKYSLLGLMKTLANELKSKNIRVNAVSPGMMNTKFISKIPSLVKQKYLLDSKEFTPLIKVVDAINNILNSSINGQNILIK